MENLKFALGFGLLAVALAVILVSLSLLWRRKDERPKGDVFKLCLGILSHWIATFNARAISFATDNGWIAHPTDTNLYTGNLLFAIGAGVLYFRALTPHIRGVNYRVVAATAIAIVLAAWMWKAYGL